MKALVTMTDIQASFEAIEKLSAAASQIRKDSNESKLKAYCLIIAHLEVIKAGTGKKDAKAKETFDELLKLNVKKSKARRYVEYAQAWRRNEEATSSGDPAENANEMVAYEITTESALKNFLFPKATKWHDRVVKLLVKEWETENAKNGEIKANKKLADMFGELAAAYKKGLSESQKKHGPVVATQKKDTKRQNQKTKEATPPAAA